MDEARRDRYLDAAMALFSEQGFAGTSMDEVVHAVGGSKATLYRYFPSKEALVTGLIDRVAATMGRGLVDPTTTELPLAEALQAVGRAACEGVTSPGAIAVLRLCLAERDRFPELARTVWEHGPAVTYARLHALLADREARGELVVEDRQLAAEQLIAGIVGHIQLEVAFGMAEPPTEAETEARVASAVTTFLARYATTGASAPAAPGR